MKNKLLNAAAISLFVMVSGSADAGFISLTNTNSNNWEIQFSPITLTMKSNPGSSNLDWLVFEDFFAGASTGNGLEIGTQTIAIGINGGVATSFDVNNSVGIYPGAGGIDDNDLFINIAQDNATANAGDTVTVSQNGTGVQFSTSGVVPALNSNWNGQVAFWANGNGPMVTENAFITAVPEPTSLAIFGLGLMGLSLRRLKKKS